MPCTPSVAAAARHRIVPQERLELRTEVRAEVFEGGCAALRPGAARRREVERLPDPRAAIARAGAGRAQLLLEMRYQGVAPGREALDPHLRERTHDQVAVEDVHAVVHDLGGRLAAVVHAHGAAQDVQFGDAPQRLVPQVRAHERGGFGGHRGVVGLPLELETRPARGQLELPDVVSAVRAAPERDAMPREPEVGGVVVGRSQALRLDRERQRRQVEACVHRKLEHTLRRLSHGRGIPQSGGQRARALGRGRARRYCAGHASLSTPSSAAARSGHEASRSDARPSRTTSASPAWRMSSACCGSVIRPTAAVAMPAARADRRGERHLVARAERDLLRRELPPEEQSTRSTPSGRAAAASAIDSPSAQPPSTQSRGRDAHRQRQLRGPGGAHRLDDLEQQPRAPREVAAVGVAAPVGERREELVQQVAVRRVQLEQPEAGRDARGARTPRTPRRRRRCSPASSARGTCQPSS